MSYEAKRFCRVKSDSQGRNFGRKTEKGRGMNMRMILTEERREAALKIRYMVPPTRIERAARGLGNRCSIRLSYGGILYHQHVIDSFREGKWAGVIRVFSLADALSKSSSLTWLYRLYIFSDL